MDPLVCAICWEESKPAVPLVWFSSVSRWEMYFVMDVAWPDSDLMMCQYCIPKVIYDYRHTESNNKTQDFQYMLDNPPPNNYFSKPDTE